MRAFMGERPKWFRVRPSFAVALQACSAMVKLAEVQRVTYLVVS